MGRKLAASSAVLVGMLAAATAATAAPFCARPDDVSAIRTAAVQQELMVAALTCNDVASFNAFQTSYLQELRRSDFQLQRLFRRLYGGGGMAQYHAYKTRLANDSSMRSINDNAGYCREAAAVFAAALGPVKPTLADFVAGVTVEDGAPVPSCALRAAALPAGGAALPAIVPTPNPLRVAVLTPPAQPAAAAAPVAPAAPAPAVTASVAAPSAAGDPAAAPPAKEAVQAAPAPEKKSSGWLSGVFN